MNVNQRSHETQRKLVNHMPDEPQCGCVNQRIYEAHIVLVSQMANETHHLIVNF
jgi:hypothetical protein